MRGPLPNPRRRVWPVVVPLVLAVALVVAWVGLWFYAAGAAETSLAGWRAREAKAGRIFECGSERIGGFPFRIEVSCANPTAELRGSAPALTLKGRNIVASVQLYQPTLVRAEFTGPMTIAERGQQPGFEAGWRAGQSTLRGTPRAPEEATLLFDDPIVERLLPDNARQTVAQAKRVELQGRIAEGSVNANPVLDVIVNATAAAASPEFHPLAAQPFDADIAARLRGLANFAPKPWPARFRELQQRGGKIEISKARLQQGESIVVANGTLSLTQSGNLDGQLEMTVVGLEALLKALDLEKLVSQGRVAANIDKLDRLIPGLGSIARKHAAPGILAGLGIIGKRTTLEDKPALAVPLRFVDGQVMLGPIPLGRTPPLF
jgi:hypothetical protein